MRRAASLFLLLIVTLSGCFGPQSTPQSPGTDGNPVGSPVSFAHLNADGALKTFDEGETRSFLWEGVVGAGGSVLLLGSLPGSATQTVKFQVDANVGFVNATLTHAVSKVALQVALLNDANKIECATLVVPPGDACTAPVPTQLTQVVKYGARVRSFGEDRTEDLPFGWAVPDVGVADTKFQLKVTLHPRTHIPTVDLSGLLDDRYAFRQSDTGVDDAGEPTIGVTKSGVIFVVEGVQTMRSRDDGKTWQDASPPGTLTTFDPMLFVDSWTGRVYTDHNTLACSILSWSDDEGQTWISNPAACGLPGNDHQKLAVGSTNLPVSAYPGIVYYSYLHLGEGIWVSRSLDGGLTWTSSLAVSEVLHGFPITNTGPVTADRVGNVYVPVPLRDGGMLVSASHDYGLTWTPVRVGDGAYGSQNFDPGLGIDTDGNVYVSYEGPQGMQMAYSTDRGKTWTQPRVVSPPGLKSFTLTDATVGDKGRVAIAYLATAESARGPNDADGYARWHLYLTSTENALAPDAVWTTARVTPESDPVQVGSICTGGVSCTGNRNLLDFIDVQPGPDGRVYIAYTDGCPAGCQAPSASHNSQGVVGIQFAGPRLFVDKAPWAR